MEPRNDPFQPKRVDEQVEWLTQFVQKEAQEHNQSAQLVQRLQDYYVKKRKQDTLDQAWKQIAQRYEDSVLASSGEEQFQDKQGKPKSLDQYRMQQERISAMQKDMTQTFSQRKTSWKRGLSVFAAILCTLVLVGGFLTIFNAMHTNRTTNVGSQITGTPPTPSPGSPVTNSISKAILTASNTGSGEGIGPGLSGITASKQFTVGKKFWIFFLLNDGGSTVTVKWYANNQLYKSASQYQPPLSPVSTPSKNSPLPTPSRNSPPPAKDWESNFSITYNRPAEGKVELYWKSRLMVTMFFVVKPKA